MFDPKNCLNCKYDIDCEPWLDEPHYDFCILEEMENGRMNDEDLKKIKEGRYYENV